MFYVGIVLRANKKITKTEKCIYVYVEIDVSLHTGHYSTHDIPLFPFFMHFRRQKRAGSRAISGIQLPLRQ